MSQLEELLQQCTVKLSLPGRMGWGTGFFVAPEWILTCAHVVQEAKGESVQVRWQKQENWGQAVVERSLPDPYDLALLRVTLPTDANPPCVYLDAAIQSRDPLYLFGYPDQDFPNGCPVTFNCEGLTGDEPALIKFALGQVRPGMSGAPLLNQRTGKVCGIVKFTRDRSFDLGGGAIPTSVILAQFPELLEQQRSFHQYDRRWNTLVVKPSDIDFQPYLSAIASTYKKWWQFYTLTDAEGQQRQSQEVAPIFDFGLMVQTLKKEEREQRQEGKPEKEKVERFSVLDGLRKYALGEKPEHVLLIGRPGSGKSTALARLMLEEATTQKSEFLKNSDFSAHSPCIPVLVELRYWQDSITNLIHTAIARHDPTLKAVPLDRLLTNALLLFDGVNELPSEEARSQLSDFRRNHPKVPMIFTTRDLSLGGDLGIEQKLEMQPLTKKQMQAFIRAYVPEQTEAMLRQLRVGRASGNQTRLQEFGQTPLLLWMLCEVFQQTSDKQLPSNLAGVFQAFTAMYEISSVRKHEVALLKGDVRPLSDRRLWKKALKALASVMMQGETPADFRVVIHRDEAERELSRIFPTEQFPVRDILDDLLKYHLLQNRSLEQIEFCHPLIQEYYVAKYFCDRADWKNLATHIIDPHWKEVFLLASALSHNKSELFYVIKYAIDSLVENDQNIQIFLDRVFEKSKVIDKESKSDTSSSLSMKVRAFYFAINRNDVLDLNPNHSYSRPKHYWGFENILNSSEVPLDCVIDYEAALLLYNAYSIAANPPYMNAYSYKHIIQQFFQGYERLSLYSIDHEYKIALENIKDSLPEFSLKNWVNFKEWALKEGQIWADRLRELTINYRNIRQNLNLLDDEQWKLLSLYYDANNLLMYCLNNSGEVDDKLRRDIEETLLLPIAAIQENCKYYNYQIWHEAMQNSNLELKNAEQGTEVGQTTTIFNIETLNAINAALNLGGTIHGDQTGTQSH